MPYGGDFQLITYEMIWDNMFHNTREDILGGLLHLATGGKLYCTPISAYILHLS